MDERSYRTRSALLDAAEQLFAERGFGDVGNRELVARAGVNLAAIQYHFGSKRGLYLETVRRSLHRPEIRAVWELLRDPPAARGAAARRLAEFVHALVGRLLTDEDLSSCTKLMLREALRPSEALQDFVRDFSGPHEELVLGLVRRIAPERTPVRARLAARSLLAQIFHQHIFRPFFRHHPPPNDLGPEAARVLADHVIDFTLRGLGCSPAMVDAALRAPPAAAPERRVARTLED